MAMLRVVLLASILVGCASSQSASNYVRVNGPTDPGQVSIALAQCQGEGAVAVADYVDSGAAIPWAAGMLSRSAKEASVVRACMARNGFVAPQ